MGNYIPVLSKEELSPGSGKVVEVGGKTLAVFNINGDFFAIDNTCLHRGGPLGEGFLDEKSVSCPWHGWQFDVTSGKCTTNPALGVKCYPVKIEGDKVNILVE